MAATLDLEGTEVNVLAHVGDDLTPPTFTITDDDGNAYVWTGATVDAFVLPMNGGPDVDWTASTPSAGELDLSLSDAQTTALGAGRHPYRVRITKAGVTRTFVYGRLILT